MTWNIDGIPPSRSRGFSRWLCHSLLCVGLAATGALPACSLYRVAVQQGNIITQEMVDRLRPGMSHEQVAYILGEPVVRNPFDEDQWDYVYTLRVPGRLEDQRKLSLVFTDGALSRLEGDFKPNREEEAKTEGDANTPDG